MNIIQNMFLDHKFQSNFLAFIHVNVKLHSLKDHISVQAAYISQTLHVKAMQFHINSEISEWLIYICTCLYMITFTKLYKSAVMYVHSLRISHPVNI